MVEPGRYTLATGIPVQVSPAARRTLVAIEDSRCPEGVHCIWAGRIVYQFERASCGQTERFGLTPADPAPAAAAPHALPSHTLTLAPALRVTLAPGEPPPRGPANASPVRSVKLIVAPD